MIILIDYTLNIYYLDFVMSIKHVNESLNNVNIG